MKPKGLSFVLLFLLLIVLELSCLAYLVLERRMVVGHDGFELLAHQWYFINSKVSHGEIPYWTPFMTHGLPTWWFFIYSRVDMFSNIAMLFSGCLKGINFLVLYYGGLFFDKFVLLVGVWLLARRYYSNALTVFFVSSMVMASTIAYTQNSFPLIMLYSIPLTLELLHRFFETYRWKWFFLAAFLLCTVSVNVYYFIPVISLAIFVYFAGLAPGLKRGAGTSFSLKSDLGWSIATISLGLLMLGLFTIGHDSLIHIDTTQRSGDASVALDTFLGFAGGTDLFKWWELLLGISPQLDYTLYMGLLAIPLIAIGALSHAGAYKRTLVISSLFFLLFSCATPVSAAAYYLWPLMKYFRHIALVAPLVKLYLCFLAGFGFQQLFDPEKSKDNKHLLVQSLMAGLVLGLNGIFLCRLMSKPQESLFIIKHLGNILLTAIGANFSADFIHNTLFYMAIFSFLGAIAFFVRPWVKYSAYASSFILLFMVLHLLDIYWYASQQMDLRTFKMSAKQYDLLEFRKVPYILRRSTTEESQRGEFMPMLHLSKGAICDSINNFTLHDQAKSKYRVDFCLKPYEKLFKVFDYKEGSQVFQKLSGTSLDKIQFFSHAYGPAAEEDIIKALKDKEYKGDILIYESARSSVGTGAGVLKDLDLSQNQRLDLPYQVRSFSPNHITIEVDTKDQQGVWMQYCDSWYPAWKATVNQKPQEIMVGNLAYKAIALQKGRNIIQLSYDAPAIKLLYSLFQASSLIWLGIIVVLLVL